MAHQGEKSKEEVGDNLSCRRLWQYRCLSASLVVESGWERGESTNIVQTRQAGSLLTVDIQTSFHLIIGILDMEVAPIKSANCADWPSKHLSLAF